MAEEGWWLLLGIPERGEVLAFRRVSVGRQASSSLRFCDPGPGVGLTLYLLSGPYLGLDQEHLIRPPAVPYSEGGSNPCTCSNLQLHQRVMHDRLWPACRSLEGSGYLDDPAWFAFCVVSPGCFS